MNRRGFLKAAGAAAIIAPAGAAAPVGRIGEAIGVLGGGAGMAMGAGIMPAANIPVAAAGWGAWAGLAWDALRDIRDKENARMRWWFVHRKHRIAVRRGREEPLSARIIWLRMKLKEARRKANQIGDCANPDDGAIVLPRRLRYKKRDARERAAYRARGFLKMPWES